MTRHGTQLSSQLRRLITGIVAFVLICSHSTAVVAQAIPDIDAPIVEIEIVDFAAADLSQVFTVQAADDFNLGDVSLHYRRAGENVFQKVLMESVGDTGYFSVAIETDPTDLRSFEYYAQALDLTGNRTVKGFAFDPFVRMIGPASESSLAKTQPAEPASNTGANSNAVAAAATTTAATDLSKPRISTTRKWVYVALGVLAAGAIASLATGGDSGGGSSDGDNSTTVPLTVILTDPIQ